MENDNSLRIITNNIKGIQNRNKRLSITEYFLKKQTRMEYYFNKKHIQLPAMKEN